MQLNQAPNDSPPFVKVTPTQTVGFCPELLKGTDMERYHRKWDRSGEYRRGAERGIASVLEQVQ